MSLVSENGVVSFKEIYRVFGKSGTQRDKEAKKEKPYLSLSEVTGADLDLLQSFLNRGALDVLNRSANTRISMAGEMALEAVQVAANMVRVLKAEERAYYALVTQSIG